MKRNIYQKIIQATFVILLSIAGGLLLQHSTSASGETYSYKENGSKIEGRGGRFPTPFIFNKSPYQENGKNIYSGVGTIIKSGSTKCYIQMQISAGNNATSGDISAPKALNDNLTIATGADSEPIATCKGGYASSQGEFNKTINIGGGTSDPTQAAELPGNREIIATIWSEKPLSEVPTSSVQASLLRLDGVHSGVSGTLSWNGDNSGTKRWTNNDPAQYRVCITSSVTPFPFPFAPCQDVTKELNKPLIVNFGDPNLAYNEKGKQITAHVRLNIPGHQGIKTYGPFDLVLLKADGTPVNSNISIDPQDVGQEGMTTPPQRIDSFATVVDGVDPGDYKLCIKDHTDLCSAFTKQPNQETDVYIDIPADQAKNFEQKKESSCAIEGIGWIVCPVVNFMAKIVNGAYGFVSSLLVIQPLVTTGGNTGIYGAWSIMRNFANVAFVIAFLIIIFSQLTSVGVSNYGIKKMLPRLVVAAVLVNISFWVCAIAVDLSNIIGGSLTGLFGALKAQLTPPELGVFNEQGDGWVGVAEFVVSGAIGVGIALYVGLAALLPALIAALLAIVTVFLVLTLRQALVILLIVVSPLAFVAYLLPNTENLFNKWRSLLQTLLLMYPIIAGIFGASAFASQIVMNNAPDGDYKIAIQIMGALISIIPLAITPVVMKSAGGLLNRFAGVVNNPNRGPFDRMRKGAQGYRDYRQSVRGRNALSKNGPATFGGGRFRRQAKRDAVRNGVKAEMARESSQYIARELQGNPNFANKVAGGGAFTEADAGALQRALSGAQFTVEKAELEEVQAEAATISHFDAKDLRQILDDSSASSAKKAAALDRLVKVSDAGDYADMIDRYGSDDSDGSAVIRRTLAKSLSENGPGFLKSSDIDNIARGQMGKMGYDAQGNATGAISSSLAEMAKKNAAAGVYSQQKMVADTKGNLKFAFDNADAAGQRRMVDTANDLKNNDTLKGSIKHNADAIDNISRGTTP